MKIVEKDSDCEQLLSFDKAMAFIGRLEVLFFYCWIVEGKQLSFYICV